LDYRQIQAAGEAPPVQLGPRADWRPQGVAQAPGAGELPQAAKWSITVPAGALDNLSELFLEVKYQGDVARFSADRKLLVDDFYNGKPWMIGLSRFLPPNGQGNPNSQSDPNGPAKFELSILPLRKDAPVYFEFTGLELSAPPQFAANGQIDKLESLRLVPEYQLEISPQAH